VQACSGLDLFSIAFPSPTGGATKSKGAGSKALRLGLLDWTDARKQEGTRKAFSPLSANGGAVLHRELFDKILASLDSASSYEWNAILTFRDKSQHWTAQDAAQVEEAFQEYRLRGVIEEFDGRNATELEGLRNSPKEMQKRHRVSFKGALKKLDENIRNWRLHEQDEEDDSYQPVATSATKREPDNEDEVRRLFGSLIA
jgi:hypothetical protein